jgi:polar amino acid transport system substrate-binding protein
VLQHHLAGKFKTLENRKTMNKFSKLIVGASIAICMFSSNAYALKLGVAAEPYPPFAEKDASGTWQGWEIEIGNALCAAMGEECEWVEVAWDGIIPALMAKKFDVIVSSMSITEERMKTIDFTDKYYNTPAVIIAPKGSSIDGTPGSVSGKIVGVQVSTTHENYVSKHLAGSADSIKTYATFDEHNQDLVAGRIDAVVADSLALEPFLNSDSGACCEVKGELSDVSIFGPGAGGGIRKEDTELKARFNDAIKKIRADGTYKAISDKYFTINIYGAE